MKLYNRGFHQIYQQNKMTLGLFFPLESYQSDIPTMGNQESLAAFSESLGFDALWFRDVPLRDPTFGDVGQIYDPFTYLSWIAARTSEITLVTGSIVLPFRHPIHVAKSISSIDALSNGRLVVGVASRDRPIEFDAFKVKRGDRGKLYRENYKAIEQLLYHSFPHMENENIRMTGSADLLPKPENRIAMLTTGNSRQSLDWIAKNSAGWISYPRSMSYQMSILEQWRSKVEKHSPGTFKPFTQSLYIDLGSNPYEESRPIHLGFKIGRFALIELLNKLRDIGVNHVAINLKYGSRQAKEVIQELGEEVLPYFKL